MRDPNVTVLDYGSGTTPGGAAPNGRAAGGSSGEAGEPGAVRITW
ncbi:hypothetical protein [Streptomyces violascens]